MEYLEILKSMQLSAVFTALELQEAYIAAVKKHAKVRAFKYAPFKRTRLKAYRKRRKYIKDAIASCENEIVLIGGCIEKAENKKGLFN